MTKLTISSGVNHRVPKDLRNVLEKDSDLLELWNGLTPLARNEWICWLTIYKKDETRAKHLKRLPTDVKKGHKRPCCWPGCPHRRPNAAKWFSKKK
ncbi:YdeI/OmpD-associated family protein [Candidatus Nomurabacteria bacterium]|nr:YdeI/OmpD-associated family protein [Candidatus Nomurabacteria bacterium]MCB9818277.1 YdeI/OmpD-associated family protein [Candidatus Nomurabacteria bacterium]